MRVKKIIPCVCVDHKPDASDSVYYGMPQLKVSGGFETSTQFYSPYCPNCGRGRLLRIQIRIFGIEELERNARKFVGRKRKSCVHF